EMYPTKDEIEEARKTRDVALQKQASEVGQQKTLVTRLDELTKQVAAQVSTLKLSMDAFSEESAISVQQDLLAKMDQLIVLRDKSELLSNTIADNEHKLKVARDKLATLELAHNELLKNLHDLEIRISSVQANIDALSKT
ncbi:MAG: ATPase involved in DNA repair-like protein, partial [Veillonella sp. DORA_B_18_19_23]